MASSKKNFDVLEDLFYKLDSTILIKHLLLNHPDQKLIFVACKDVVEHPLPSKDKVVIMDHTTRLVLIDHRSGAAPLGRAVDIYPTNIETSLQDGGQTLKIFCNDKKTE